MSETNKAVGIAGVLGALATSATAAPKRAATDPLKNANNNERYGAFKKTPDRWRVATTTEWGDDRSMESELTTVIRDADPSQWPALEKNLLKVLANRALEAEVMMLTQVMSKTTMIVRAVAYQRERNRSDIGKRYRDGHRLRRRYCGKTATMRSAIFSPDGR